MDISKAEIDLILEIKDVERMNEPKMLWINGRVSWILRTRLSWNRGNRNAFNVRITP
jgi:hypothetical protein